MSKATKWMDQRFYPDQGDRWDDHLFHDRVVAALEPTHRLLDLGAGSGARGALDFRDHCAFVAGVDVDPIVKENPYLHEARVQEPPRYAIPFDDAEFDVVCSNSVMEHVDDPVTFLAEVSRVLKPGGRLLAKTPNKRHYMPWIASHTPTSFHQSFNRRRGRDEVDTFPTVYKVNTEEQVRALAADAGLVVASIDLVEGRPEYLRMTAPTYAVGLAVERGLNASPRLARFRAVLFMDLRKPA